MKTNENNSAIQFLCYRRGAPVILPFEQAHLELWEADLAYLVPTGGYRYTIGGKAREFLLGNERVGDGKEKLCRGDLELLFKLHSQRAAAITARSLGISKHAFTKRRSRLGGIFPVGHDPIERINAVNELGRACLGYLLSADVKPFMIAATNPANTAFDFGLFLDRPSRFRQTGT